MSLTISAASVNDLVADPSSITGYAASKAIVIEGQITPTQASSLNSVDAISITATVAPAAASVLSAITVRSGRTNAFVLTPTETSATASVLKAVKDKTTLNGDFANVATITASPSADITALFAPLESDGTSANSTFKSDITINVNDTSIAASTLNAINTLTSTDVVATATTITGGASDVKSALGAGITHEADVAVTITEATTDAALLNDVNGLTEGLVTVQSSRVTGTYGGVNTALAASAVGTAIAGMSAINVTLTGNDYSPTQINTIDGLTTGTITASVDGTGDGDDVVKAVLLHTTNGLQNLDGTHILTIPPVTDTSLSGADLLQLDGATTLPITVTAATTITGVYADIVAAYAANEAGTIVGLGNEAITVTGGITVAQANTLNALTPGVVTATISTTDMATLAGLTLNLDSNGAQVLDGGTPVENVYTITPADTTVAASALTALNSKAANGTAIDATNVTTVTGTLAEVVAIYASGGIVAGISNLGDEAITITDTGSLNADHFQTINTRTTGVVTASGTVTNLTGSAANVKAVLAADNAATDDGNDLNEGTALTDNPTVTVTGDTAAAADLIAIDSDTSGLVTVNSTTITGTKENIATVLTANAANPVDGNGDPTFNTITGLASTGANAVNLTISNAVAIADLDDYTDATTGVVTATVTGANITTLLTNTNKAKIGTGNALNFSLTGSTVDGNASTSIAASDLIELQALTSGSILVVVDGSITGSIADLKTVYAANTAKSGGAAPAGSIFSGLEAEPIVVATTETTTLAADLNYLNGKNGDNTVTHSTTALSGTKADIATAFAADSGDGATLVGLGADVAITVTDSSITCANLEAVNLLSTATIISTATEIIGTADQLEDTLLRNVGKKWNGDRDALATATNEFITGLDAVNVTASANLTPLEINFLEDYTTGTISATVTGASAAALLGSANKLDTLDRVHNLTITVTDTTITGANIATLNAATSGTVNINSTVLQGTASQILAAYNAGDTVVANLGNEAVTITGGISVADLNTLAGKTTGAITATITDTAAATLKTISESGNNLTITVADTTASVADITAIDALTASLVTVSSTTITGTNSELLDLADLKTAGSVSYGHPNMTVTDPVTVAQANAINALTTDSTTTATISDTTEALLDDLAKNDDDSVNAYTLNLSETSYVAGDLITLNGLTSVPINASAVTTLTGTAADILTVLVENSDFDTDYTSAKARTITGLDDVAVTPTAGQTATIAQIFGIEKLTTGLVTATVTAGGVNQGLDHLIDSTSGIGLTNPNNAISVTVNDGGATDQTITAADLLTLNSRTTGLITVSVTTITGSVADLKTAFAANDATATATTQITGLEADTVTVTYPTGADTSISATDLNILDDATTGLVTFTNATSLTGVGALDDNNASAVRTALTSMGAVSPGVAWGSGDAASDVPVTLTGNVSVADANIIAGLTGGAVTATITEGDMATLANIAETGHAYTVTVTDATAAAGALNTLNGKTTVALNLSAVTTITGAENDIRTLYAANNAETPTVTGLGNEAITCSGDNAGNALTVAEINVLDGLTTGAITASIAEGTIATLDAIEETGNVLALNVSDGTVDAATLNNLRAKTTGIVNVQAATINGSLSDIAKIYAAQTAGTVTSLGAETVTISDTGTVLASDLNVIDEINATAINAATVTAVTGTVTEVNTAYASDGVTGLGNEAITITDGTVAAADLITANNNTTGVVTVNSTAITGTNNEINTLYAASAIGQVSGLGNESITVSDSITAAEANILDAYTTGVITASISSNDIDNLATLTGTGNSYTVSVADSAISASNLNALNAKTTGTVNVTATSITGTAADLVTAYAAQGTGVTGLGSEVLTVTGTASVAQINTLGAATSGTLTATVSDGDMVTLKTLAESGNALNATITDTTLAATDLTTLVAGTTGIVDVDSTTLTGTNSEKLAAYAAQNAGSVTGLGKTFDAASYLASHVDLLNAFGSDTVRAKSHFFEFGVDEARNIDSFDEKSYLASYSDLLAAFGTDTTKATTHYSEFGFSEGRSVDNFDDLGYIASYSDLIGAFGTDKAAAVDHYINFGYTENRSVTFNAKSYLDGYSDLREAFGTNEELAKQHYIEFGYNEGRVLA